MRSLEPIDGTNWEEFTGAPVAVLMLARKDCDKCAAWTRELTAFLAEDTAFADVRFGKMYLDQGGLIGFKRAHSWIAEVDVLPFNVIWANGERVKTFAGGGMERLLNRLKRVCEGRSESAT